MSSKSVHLTYDSGQHVVFLLTSLGFLMLFLVCSCILAFIYHRHQLQTRELDVCRQVIGHTFVLLTCCRYTITRADPLYITLLKQHNSGVISAQCLSRLMEVLPISTAPISVPTFYCPECFFVAQGLLKPSFVLFTGW